MSKINKDGCIHGYIYCPICKTAPIVKNCPVPLLWKTHNKGKIYVFEEFWTDFISFLKNCELHGFLPSVLYKKFNINDRVFRKWRNENTQPLLYSRKEFWDFFLSGNFLDSKKYIRTKNIDFSDGVPINFHL